MTSIALMQRGEVNRMTDRKVIYLDDAIDALAHFTEKSPTGRTAQEVVKDLPPAQPEKRTEERTKTHACDCISRQAAIDAVIKRDANCGIDSAEVLRALPSAQPEQHTCVNCGRTINNGGWYADGRTRCPIEEHYALPKDGYCHLWEKRNVTDDDYPERRIDGRD